MKKVLLTIIGILALTSTNAQGWIMYQDADDTDTFYKRTYVKGHVLSGNVNNINLNVSNQGTAIDDGIKIDGLEIYFKYPGITPVVDYDKNEWITFDIIWDDETEISISGMTASTSEDNSVSFIYSTKGRYKKDFLEFLNGLKTRTKVFIKITVTDINDNFVRDVGVYKFTLKGSTSKINAVVNEWKSMIGQNPFENNNSTKNPFKG